MAPAGAHELFEREHDLDQLVAAARRAVEGRGTVVMVEGAAGVGKTALLDAFRHLVPDAFTPLHASGAELERELAFGVVRQLFERLLRGLPDDERAEILGGAAGLAAPVLLEPAPTAGPEAGHAAMHGLYWLAAALAARRPLLLMIDDAHLADTASQTWLAYLARRLDGVALLLVVARRTPRDGLAPDADPAGAVERVAAGSIADAVLVRLAPLGREATAVAEAVAVLSSDATLDRVAALAGLPLEAAAAEADSLVPADVLAAESPLRFLHPIMRAAVHEQMPAQRRAMAHLAAAELLLGDGAGAERAAWHLLHAPRSRRAWVVETLRAAAAAAAARGAPETAVALLRRALAESPDSEHVLLELAQAEFLVQDPAAVERARDALAAAGTAARRAQAGLLAARALTPLGRYDEAVEVLEGVAGEAAAMDAPSRLAVRVESLMLGTWHHGLVGLREPLVDLGADRLPGATPTERMLLALRVMELSVSARPREESLRLGRRVLAHADPGDPADENAILLAGRCIGLADEPEDALRAFTAVIDGGRARGAVATVATALPLRAEVHYHSGRLADAEADAREALAIGVEHDMGQVIPAAVAYLAHVLLDREPAQAA